MPKLFGNIKILLLLSLIITLTACTATQEVSSVSYINNPEIAYPKSDDNSEILDDFYLEVAKDVPYSLTNANQIIIYRSADTVVVEIDYNQTIGYMEITNPAAFFEDLFVKRRGDTLLTTGALGGRSKKLYDDNYKFWNEAYLVIKNKEKDIYTGHYTLNENQKLVLKDEVLSEENLDLFKLEDKQLERFTNLEKLKELGDISYYKNAIGKRLYIDILSKGEGNIANIKPMQEKIESIFSKLDKKLMYEYNASYPKIIIRFRDDKGIYFKGTYISNIADGFNAEKAEY